MMYGTTNDHTFREHAAAVSIFRSYCAIAVSIVLTTVGEKSKEKAEQQVKSRKKMKNNGMEETITRTRRKLIIN